jgi:site-specific recombinase XerD
MSDEVVTPLAEDRLTVATDLEALAARVRTASTRRAYRADWAGFASWCAAQGLDALPAAPATVGLYLTARASTLKVATLSRKVSAIAVAHRMAGYGFDSRHPTVADVLAGIRRTNGSTQRRVEPLTTPRLKQVLTGMGDALGDLRDRALLLVATAAALRRCELTALDVTDIVIGPEGLRVTIRRSKADQEGHGVTLAVGRTGTATCPAAAYEAWLAAAGHSEGAAFRAVDRHARLGGRLSGNAVALIVQRRTAAAGLDAAAYAGHSMRAGFATSAAHAGIGEIRIAEQTRHASLAVLRRDVREGQLFEQNLAAEIGL